MYMPYHKRRRLLRARYLFLVLAIIVMTPKFDLTQPVELTALLSGWGESKSS
jgi:hypothetical protein